MTSVKSAGVSELLAATLSVEGVVDCIYALAADELVRQTDLQLQASDCYVRASLFFSLLQHDKQHMLVELLQPCVYQGVMNFIQECERALAQQEGEEGAGEVCADAGESGE